MDRSTYERLLREVDWSQHPGMLDPDFPIVEQMLAVASYEEDVAGQAMGQLLEHACNQDVLDDTVRELPNFLHPNAEHILDWFHVGMRLEQLSQTAHGLPKSQHPDARFVKKQQMRWTPLGAHLLLQVRTAELNGDLRGVFERWYPGLLEEALPAARSCPRFLVLSSVGTASGNTRSASESHSLRLGHVRSTPTRRAHALRATGRGTGPPVQMTPPVPEKEERP